ncbi:MAG: arylamine N-acetyltransferase family protein [Pyrinomonadaceae bacterium]
MNAEEYLSRIATVLSEVSTDIAGLRLLQRRQLLNVPFENLDIHWHRRITIDLERFYQKIVVERRGGFCYELNGLFNELLLEFGFETRLLSARVSDGSGGFSPEYDHLAILVMIGEMQYLADVGFGAFTVEPLQVAADVEQTDEAGTFVIRRFDEGYFEVAKMESGEWKSEYIFRPIGHDLAEFAARCDWHQTSPESHFMQRKVCSLLTPGGRKTLTDLKYIVTTGDAKVETPVASEAEFDEILLREFGIVRRGASVDAVLA